MTWQTATVIGVGLTVYFTAVALVAQLVLRARAARWHVEDLARQGREVYRAPLTLADRVVVVLGVVVVMCALLTLGLMLGAVWTNRTDHVDDVSNRLGVSGCLTALFGTANAVVAYVAHAQRKSLNRWWADR